MSKLKYIALFMLFILNGTLFSQELTAKAHALYKEGKFEESRVMIDSAITTPEQSNSQTWQLRGLIYRKLESSSTLHYREIALESFIKAKETDLQGVYTEKINEYLYNTIIRYYNDAATYLENGSYTESERSYKLYKEKYLSLLDPQKSFDEQDVEFYNALGSAYIRHLNQVKGKDYEITFALAINAHAKVLVIDSLNYLANLNTGVLYYNAGADLIMNQDPDAISIEQLLENIAKSEELFQKAKPHMLIAYRTNPESVEVLEALAGIYYGLNDDTNYLIYQTKLDQINLPKYLDAHQKNPNDKEILRQLVRIYSSTLKDDAQYQKFKTILDQLGG